MKDPKRPKSEDFDEATYAALRRELGFEGMTHEQLFRELFGDAFHASPPEPEAPVRVEQVVDDRPRRPSKRQSSKRRSTKGIVKRGPTK